MSIISVYVGRSIKDRINLWSSLRQLQGNIILTGDFNMVEFAVDRWQGKGIVLAGQELRSWNDTKETFDLFDPGELGTFTWQNYSLPLLARKARLDRAYIFSTLANMFIRIKVTP